ncbi:MAG: TMEM143 family protein [Pirellulaceae bacterium]|jgi:hypothetical protein|nr:TMEM143 family protein [Pirellulaceae bacterium]
MTDSEQTEQQEATTPVATEDDGREHFIPIRKTDLIALLTRELNLVGDDAAQFHEFCRLLDATLHFEHQNCLEALKESYAFFNPDAVITPLEEIDDAKREQLCDEMIDRLVGVLHRANYRKLTNEEIDHAVGAASEWGIRLSIDFEVFERLEVFARGDCQLLRARRDWRTWFREVDVLLPIFQRLVVVFRLRDHDRLDDESQPRAVYIKLFKNIPKRDLDMLLPGSQIRMSLMDRGKIIFPTASGVAVTALKLKGVVWLAFTTGLWGFIALCGVVVGAIGYGVKSFFGYQRTKDKYQLSLTKHLYYQNLGNNAGVLFNVLNEAEDQEAREAILGYALLWREAGEDGWTPQDLDARAERVLSEQASIEVDVEIHDVMAKLQRLQLAHEQGSGRYVAVPIDEALRQLDHAWDNFFSYHDSGHEPCRPHSYESRRGGREGAVSDETGR